MRSAAEMVAVNFPCHVANDWRGTMLDVIAWLIIGAMWIFGGAAYFVGDSTEYKHALLGWSLLNVFVIVAVLVCIAAFWALERVAT